MPAFLVATYDLNGQPNIMTAAWGGILCSEPPYIGVSIRPTRWTHEAIEKNKAFTVNFPKSTLAAETDFLGIISGKDHDKLERTALTAVKSAIVNAPYIDECPVLVECEMVKSIELGTHTLFVGHILDVKANEHALTDGKLDICKVDPLIYSPTQEYYQIGAFVAKAFSIGKSLKK
jgi:flavin reductase (DIM6/NTAB) family NADH-FMN oxidoreductase RutF